MTFFLNHPVHNSNCSMKLQAVANIDKCSCDSVTLLNAMTEYTYFTEDYVKGSFKCFQRDASTNRSGSKLFMHP